VSGALRYGAILADPPWSFDTYSAKGKGKSADRHYPCMSFAEIGALPVGDLAAEDCALFLWVTMPTLPRALDVIRAWGFTYKSRAFAWAKQTCTGRHWAFGCGYGTRKGVEDCLLAVRGRPRRLETGKGVRELVVAPTRGHSRKPDEVRDRIRSLFPGPYVELFARSRAEGWDVELSNKPDKFGGAE
jgi:N6-adenosine-specific RNA methylase IME4